MKHKNVELKYVWKNPPILGAVLTTNCGLKVDIAAVHDIDCKNPIIKWKVDCVGVNGTANLIAAIRKLKKEIDEKKNG